MAVYPIQLRSGFGFIDRTGRVVIEPTLSQIGHFRFSEGLAAVTTSERKTGFIDETGAFVIEPRFQDATWFSDGLCAVRVAGKAAFIDKTGTEVFVLPDDQRFFEQLAFSEGLCRTTKDGWSGYIDREGRVVVPHTWANAGPFREGCAAVAGETTPFCYIDSRGTVVIEPRFERAWGFKDGVAAVVSDLRTVDGPILRQFKKDAGFEELRGMWGLLDRGGTYRALPAFDYSETELATTMGMLGGDVAYGPAAFAEGLALVRQKKKFGYVAATGELVIEPAFDKGAHFSEGLAAVQKRVKGKAMWGFVDKAGALAIKPAFSKVMWPRVAFSEGLCAVGVPIEPAHAAEFAKRGLYLDALYGFIDATGNFVLPPAYGLPGDFRDGLALVHMPAGLAYIDRTGAIVWSENS